MSKIIAMVNQKGGVGKTTTTINLGACLAKKGSKILIVDIDPQGNASSGVGVPKDIDKSIYDAIINEEKIEDIIQKTEIKNLDVCPSNMHLAGAELEMVALKNREKKLKNILSKEKDKYDYILIDCPPSLGMLTINALTSADSVLVPMQCEYYALEGLGQLMHTVHMVQKNLNPSLEIEGIVLTMYNQRTNLSNQVAEEVKKHFGDYCYKTVIPRNIRLSEAPSHGLPITVYDPKSTGAKAYIKLTQEFISRNK